MLEWLKRLFTGTGIPRSRVFRFADSLPPSLGFRPELAAEAAALAARLEQALPDAFLRQVQGRLAHRHPEIGEAQYRWMELELKRFFLLTALLRHVPMYSDDADRIWHEMLMFTREYQTFCDTFTGFYIHHVPNVNPAAAAAGADPDERAAFELAYAALYDVFPENVRLIGPFYRRKMSAALAAEAASGDPARIAASLRFRETADPAAARLQQAMADAVIGQAARASAYHDDPARRDRDSAYYYGADPLWMMMAFGLATDHSPFHPPEQQDRDDPRSGCAAMAPLSGGDDGGGHGDSGSGGDSGSSCSSCSSCGGGGD